MGHSASWAANICTAGHAIIPTIKKSKIQYGVRKGPPLVSILSQINPIHAFQTITFNYISILSSQVVWAT